MRGFSHLNVNLYTSRTFQITSWNRYEGRQWARDIIDNNDTFTQSIEIVTKDRIKYTLSKNGKHLEGHTFTNLNDAEYQAHRQIGFLNII